MHVPWAAGGGPAPTPPSAGDHDLPPSCRLDGSVYARCLSDESTYRWDLAAHGRHHRVEVTGSLTHTVRWYVDDQLVAAKRASGDNVRLEPGDRVGKEKAAEDSLAETPSDLGAIRLKFNALGTTRRVTWYGDGAAAARLDRGGIDLDPEPGSPAALREERIRRHPRRHAALAVAAGVAKVVLPVLAGLLVVRVAVSLPWPDWDLPAMPWPDLDLPSIPWPTVDLPAWDAPDWLTWTADKLKYVWPVVLAWILARAEIRRRRQQDALKAQLKAGAGSDDEIRSDADSSPPSGEERRSRDPDADPPDPDGRLSRR